MTFFRKGRRAMKFNKNQLNTPWIAYTIATCSAVVLFVVLTHLDVIGRGLHGLGTLISPIVMAAIIAYILNPLAGVFETYVFGKIRSERVRHDLSTACALLSFFFVVVILLVALIPQVISSIMTFAGNFEIYARSLQGVLQRLQAAASNMNIDISGLIASSGDFLDAIRSLLPKNVNHIVNTSINLTLGIFEAVIAFILAVYFLTSKDRIKSGFKFLLQAILSVNVYPAAVDFLGRCHNILLRYIIFDLLDGVIIGISNAIFMKAAGMPYIVLLSVVVGVANLVPTFGPFVGGTIGAFILVLVNPWYALWFLIFTFLIQTVDGYILKPRMFGDSLGVPAVWVLVSIIVFGRIFGILGVVVSIPLAAILTYMYQSWIVIKLEKRRESNELQRSINQVKSTAKNTGQKS